MKNFTKTFLVSVSVLAINTASVAMDVTPNKTPVVSDLTVKLSAYTDFQVGMRNQNHLVGDEKNVSEKRKGFAFFNSSAFSADISNQVNDITYGGRIALVPTARRKGGATFDGTHMYMESDFGRVEAGSPFSANYTMMIDADSIAAASPSTWSRYADLSINHLRKSKLKANPSFATSSDFFLDSKLVTKLDDRTYSSEPSRSIVYYTPKFEVTDSTKVQLGLSYAPDTSNTGAANHDDDSSGVTTLSIEDDKVYKFELVNTVKDALSAGIALEQNLADGVDFKLAVTGEHGKSTGELRKFKTKEASDDKIADETFKLSNLRTYNIGGVLNYGNFSYAASYGSLGKSLTSKELHKAGRKTDYYNGAVAYKQGPFSVSLAYFKSIQYKNTAEAITLGTDYNFAPGLKPYAQISVYNLKGKPEFYKDEPKKKVRGTVAIIGAKLSI